MNFLKSDLSVDCHVEMISIGSVSDRDEKQVSGVQGIGENTEKSTSNSAKVMKITTTTHKKQMPGSLKQQQTSCPATNSSSCLSTSLSVSAMSTTTTLSSPPNTTHSSIPAGGPSQGHNNNNHGHKTGFGKALHHSQHHHNHYYNQQQNHYQNFHHYQHSGGSSSSAVSGGGTYNNHKNKYGLHSYNNGVAKNTSYLSANRVNSDQMSTSSAGSGSNNVGHSKRRNNSGNWSSNSLSKKQFQNHHPPSSPPPPPPQFLVTCTTNQSLNSESNDPMIAVSGSVNKRDPPSKANSPDEKKSPEKVVSAMEVAVDSNEDSKGENSDDPLPAANVDKSTTKGANSGVTSPNDQPTDQMKTNIANQYPNELLKIIRDNMNIKDNGNLWALLNNIAGPMIIKNANAMASGGVSTTSTTNPPSSPPPVPQLNQFQKHLLHSIDPNLIANSPAGYELLANAIFTNGGLLPGWATDPLMNPIMAAAAAGLSSPVPSPTEVYRSSKLAALGGVTGSVPLHVGGGGNGFSQQMHYGRNHGGDGQSGGGNHSGGGGGAGGGGLRHHAIYSPFPHNGFYYTPHQFNSNGGGGGMIYNNSNMFHYGGAGGGGGASGGGGGGGGGYQRPKNFWNFCINCKRSQFCQLHSNNYNSSNSATFGQLNPPGNNFQHIFSMHNNYHGGHGGAGNGGYNGGYHNQQAHHNNYYSHNHHSYNHNYHGSNQKRHHTRRQCQNKVHHNHVNHNNHNNHNASKFHSDTASNCSSTPSCSCPPSPQSTSPKSKSPLPEVKITGAHDKSGDSSSSIGAVAGGSSKSKSEKPAEEQQKRSTTGGGGGGGGSGGGKGGKNAKYEKGNTSRKNSADGHNNHNQRVPNGYDSDSSSFGQHLYGDDGRANGRNTNNGRNWMGKCNYGLLQNMKLWHVDSVEKREQMLLRVELGTNQVLMSPTNQRPTYTPPLTPGGSVIVNGIDPAAGELVGEMPSASQIEVLEGLVDEMPATWTSLFDSIRNLDEAADWWQQHSPTPADKYLAQSHLVEIIETPKELVECPSVSPDGRDSLNQQVWNTFLTVQQTQSTYRKKIVIWKMLYLCIKKVFPNLHLYVVGSTISGFGAESSDVDMCLVSNRNSPLDSRLEAVLSLTELKKFLSLSDCFEQFHLIQAKVPILRFREKTNRIEVDLNFNNSVGIRNTHLLHCYSLLDWRVRPLVLVVKLWAKYHNINNAKMMTISSYSLALMVIHFLQCGVSPSILPCLHEMYPDKFQYGRDVSTIDMNEDMDHFESENKQSLGDLLLQFLYYYSNFDYNHFAISVRTGSCLLIEECRHVRSLKNDPQQWKNLCIEEPFEFTNTARSVYDTEIFYKIKYVFIQSYQHLQQTLDLKSILSKKFINFPTDVEDSYYYEPVAPMEHQPHPHEIVAEASDNNNNYSP